MQQSTSIMKNLSIISASLLMGSLAISSCSSNKMAASSVNDNLYFMASDVKIATQYAVANNNPSTFQNIAKEPTAPQESFSSRNVNPEYISRYGQTSVAEDDEVVYFDDNETQANSSNQPNIDVYNSFSVNNFNNNRGWGNSAFNMGLGMGFGGFSPWGMGFNDPFLNPFWGFRPGFNVGLNFGFGRPFYDPFNPFFGFGGGFGGLGSFYDPFWGNGFMGSPWGWGRPIYATGPIIVMPGNEFGNRRVVYGSRPTRGSSMVSGSRGMGQSALVPSTARAQARANAANASVNSPRRIVSSENARGASRDFSSSQNDYYNSGRSRVANTGTTRNMNSAASDRGSMSTSRGSVPSARPSAAYPSNSRGYDSPSRSSSYPSGYDRSSSPSYNRSDSPSYNRSTVPSNNSRSTSPSYNRGTSPSYNNSGSPSRSNYNNTPSYSAPSRSSSGYSGGSSYSAPSRSSGGSSGGGSYSGGSRGGRGN